MNLDPEPRAPTNPLLQEIVLCIPTVEEAEAELAQVRKECPADHFQAHKDPVLYARRQLWLQRLDRAETRVMLAKRWQASGLKGAGPSTPEAPQPKRKRRNHTVEQLVELYLRHIERMGQVEPESKEWNSSRSFAYHIGHLLRDRCAQEHREVPELPKVPLRPVDRRHQATGRPPAPPSADPSINRRRERDRQRPSRRTKQMKGEGDGSQG